MAATIVITDLGNDIEVAITGSLHSVTTKYLFNKPVMRVKKTENLCYITNSDSFNQSKDNKILELDYTKITTPTYASNDALYDGLLDMISNAPSSAYDSGTNSLIASVLNPEYAHNTSPEHLINLTNQAAGTTRYVIPWTDYKSGSLHWDLIGSGTDTVTMTVWGTLKADADDSADDDWVDISDPILGAVSKVSNSTTPEEDMAFIVDKVILKIMVKIVITGGTTNSVDVYVKKA